LKDVEVMEDQDFIDFIQQTEFFALKKVLNFQKKYKIHRNNKY